MLNHTANLMPNLKLLKEKMFVANFDFEAVEYDFVAVFSSANPRSVCTVHHTHWNYIHLLKIHQQILLTVFGFARDTFRRWETLRHRYNRINAHCIRPLSMCRAVHSGYTQTRRSLLQWVYGSKLGANTKGQHWHELRKQEAQHYKYFPGFEITNLSSVISYRFQIVTVRTFKENRQVSRLIPWFTKLISLRIAKQPHYAAW